MAEPRFLHEYKDIYQEYLTRTRALIVDGYWQLKENRLKFKTKAEDFTHIQNATEGILDALGILIDQAEGYRDKPGVQPYIEQVLSTINIHLDRTKKYYPKNEPKGFKTKTDQREEGKFQLQVFKGEHKIKSKLKDLNINNNMEGIEIEFFDNAVASLPMKDILYERNHTIRAKIESLEIDWELVMDNGLYINMAKKDIPDYNPEKHFWDQETESLQFWVSEYNKIKNGITIDGYFMSSWTYFHLNYFKTPIKNRGNKILNPDYRDNEFYVDSVKTYAEKKAKELLPAAIIFYGSRRFSKTTAESSYLHQGLLKFPTQSGNIASSNADDLASIIDKLKKSLDNIEPAFKMNIYSGKTWDKNVFFGVKSKSGREVYEHFVFNVKNIDGGSKSGSQKKAGGNPIVSVDDEIGKSSFIAAHNAAVPAFESDDGWVCQPWYTGTSGEEDLSKDAELVLRNPTEYDFLEGDWDILEFGVPKEYITWTRRKFGWFLPAQMSLKTGFKKIETNLADFLGIKSEELSKVKFYKTDWKHNTETILKRRSELTGVQLQQETVFRPIDPEECFMSAKKNPYPAQGIKRHKEKLQAEGDKIIGLARKIGLERDKENSNKIGMFLDTEREVNEYPHNGSFIDCPFLLYDDFPETRPHDPFRFVAGLDDYKQDESNPSKKGSIGAFYIFDRLKRKIVLGLASRPDPHTDFHKQMHMALDAWNAKCFPENEDMDFKKYLDRLSFSSPAMYLYNGFDASDDFSKFQNGKRQFGWRPDKNTVPIVRGYSVDFTKDNVDYYDNNGNITHTISGFEKIDDVQLLEEMVKYKPDGNSDRLAAFGSCLAIDYYLTCKYITPQSSTTRTEENIQEQFKPQRTKFFTNKRRSPFTK
jgi:hypothetical protein